MADPKQEFAERVQKYFRNMPQTVHSSPTTAVSQPSSPAAADTEDSAKTQTTPLRYNRLVHQLCTSHTSLLLISLLTRVSPTDLLGAVSYILRREVPLHSIISGTAFTALLRLVHLLESVSGSQ